MEQNEKSQLLEKVDEQLLLKQMENKKTIECKSHVSFYKSLLDQDRSAVVICNLEHDYDLW